MSRYNDIDIIIFTDKNGNSFPVKDIRPIPSNPIALSVVITNETDIDEVASRSDIYGDLAEDQTSRIFDANIIKLTENNFDVSKLSELKIPV